MRLENGFPCAQEEKERLGALPGLCLSPQASPTHFLHPAQGQSSVAPWGPAP